MKTGKHNSTGEPPRVLSEIRALLRLNPEDEALLLNALRSSVFKKGFVLDGQNEMLQYMFYLDRGTARTYYIKNGKEYNFAFSFEGQFLITPQSMMRRNKQFVFVQFLEETEVWYLPVKSLWELQSLNSGKFRQLAGIAMVRYVEYLEEHLFMLRMNAKDRYLWAIEKYPHLLEVVSVTQLASFLDVTKETLYRIRSGKY